MKYVPLNNGQSALVDDDDYEWLSAYKWRALKTSKGYSTYVFSKRDEHTIYMHRLILDAPKGYEVDHKDNNGLNNQRTNLRIATKTENRRYKPKTNNDCSSIYKGVCWDKKNNKWEVGIRINGKRKRLGRFESEIEAALVYNEAAIKFYGEYALLNEVV